MIQFIPEPKTTFRADIAALFGRFLPRNGIECKLIGAQDRHSAVGAGSSDIESGRPAGRLTRTLRFWRACWHELRVARRANCDVLQVRDFVTLGLAVLCMARIRRIPFCYWMSFLMSEARVMQARSNLRERFSLFTCMVWLRGTVEQFMLYKFVLPHADHVFVQSDAMAAYVHAKGIDVARISAVPMGVDMEQFQAGGLEDVDAQEDGVPCLAYLGTLIAPRNIETLIDVLYLVRHRWPSASLLLIGASDSVAGNQRLLDYAASRGLQQAVRITGWLPADQAWKALRHSDVALSWVPRNLFHDVSSPTKLLEYLAAGIPCVANDIPDQVAVMQQSQAGWLCESSAESVAQAVQEILNDPQAARRRAEAGPAYIATHRSYEVIAKQVAQCYRAVAAKAR